MARIIIIKCVLFILYIFPLNLLAAESYTGFHLAGLPNASYKDGEGFAAGGNLFFFQYGDGQKSPYNWNTTVAFKLSTEGMLSSYIFLDIPHAWGVNSRFNIYVEFKRYLVDDFYGLGNDPDYNLNYIDPDHSTYKDKLYYSFKQHWPGIIVSSQIPAFAPRTRHLFSFAIYDRHIEQYSGLNKLREEAPPGHGGGITSSLQYGLIYDTRDQEATPTRGIWSELLVEYAAPFLGSAYSYLRVTMTDRRYIRIVPKVIYAHRLLFEPILGDVPFYDMAVINSSYERHLGLGGSTSMRGIPRLLFVGQHKLLGNFELRFETIHMTLFKQDLTFYIHTFWDAGRVWLKHEPLVLEKLRHSCGAGLHIRWKKDLVGCIDIGRSVYSDMAVYITFRNLF